ncbi:hypothetical protein [Streptomyces acidiscabies]|uniref:hypothetical protein n=1 Tax=Streptomyces acidiscabies TaxID=42234 RepID=UPI0015BAC8D0|nr:hypothetical protein [Streptomyces acidiscabies]
MYRFLLGLTLGAAASSATWVITHSPHWTVLVGLVVAVLIWLGEFLLDDLL